MEMAVSRRFGHTTLTMPAPFGTMSICIMRGGLAGGDSGLSLTGKAWFKGYQWHIHPPVIRCEQWRVWPLSDLYGYWAYEEHKNPPQPSRAWALEIVRQMRTIYFSVMSQDIIDAARRYALEEYTPGLREEITRAEDRLAWLRDCERMWLAELNS